MLFSRTDTTQSFVGFYTFPPSDSVGQISGSSVLNSPLSVDTAQDPNLTIPTCAIISFCSNYIYSTDIEAIYVVQQRLITVLSSSSDVYVTDAHAASSARHLGINNFYATHFFNFSGW